MPRTIHYNMVIEDAHRRRIREHVALASLLLQVKPIDRRTLSTAAAIVVFVTLAASFRPARRASRVAPITALRYE